MQKLQKYVSFATTMGTAMKKSVINRIGNYDTAFEFGGEDTDMCYRIENSGYKICYVSDAKIYHDWGTVSRNIYRGYIYGRAHFKIFLKYPKKTYLETLSYIFYFIYLSFFPIVFFHNIYIMVFVLLFVKKGFEVKSISYVSQIFIYNYLVGLGFITELAYFNTKKITKLFKTYNKFYKYKNTQDY